MFATLCKKYFFSLKYFIIFEIVRSDAFHKSVICYVYEIFWICGKKVQNANCKNFQFFLFCPILEINGQRSVPQFIMKWYITLVWIYIYCLPLQNGKTSLQKWHIFLQILNSKVELQLRLKCKICDYQINPWFCLFVQIFFGNPIYLANLIGLLNSFPKIYNLSHLS